MGGLPIERKKGQDSLAQLKTAIEQQDHIFLAMTPSGSRSPKDSFKTGYLRLAHEMNIPLFLIGLDGTDKAIVLDRLVDPEGDIAAQNKSIKHYMDGTYRGIKPQNQSLSPLPDSPPNVLIGARN